MSREQAVFEITDPVSEADADARAEADARGGRIISHEAVRRWLLSLPTPTPLPRPRIGD